MDEYLINQWNTPDGIGQRVMLVQRQTVRGWRAGMRVTRQQKQTVVQVRYYDAAGKLVNEWEE